MELQNLKYRYAKIYSQTLMRYFLSTILLCTTVHVVFHNEVHCYWLILPLLEIIENILILY